MVSALGRSAVAWALADGIGWPSVMRRLIASSEAVRRMDRISWIHVRMVKLDQGLADWERIQCDAASTADPALEQCGTTQRDLDVGYHAFAFQRLSAGRDVVGEGELEAVAVGQDDDHRRQGRARGPGAEHPGPLRSLRPPAMISAVDAEISSTRMATGFS